MARARKDRSGRVKPIVLDTDELGRNRMKWLRLFLGRCAIVPPSHDLVSGRNHGSGASTWSGPPAGHAAFHGGIFVKRRNARTNADMTRRPGLSKRTGLAIR